MPFSADWTRTVPRFTNKNNDPFYHEFENFFKEDEKWIHKDEPA